MKERMTTEVLKKYLTTWQNSAPDSSVTVWLEELIELRELMQKLQDSTYTQVKEYD